MARSRAFFERERRPADPQPQPEPAKGLGFALADFAAMPPAQRFHALEQLDPALRARLLGANSLPPLPQETGPAHDYDWSSFRIEPHHSGDQAWAGSVASRRVYEDFGERGSDPERVGKGFADLAHAGFTIDFLRGKGGTHGVLATRGNVGVLSFRGTDPRIMGDLIKDADALPTPHRDGGRAHNGFQKGLAEVSVAMRDHVADAKRAAPGLRLLLTGHSLGAATAVLAALELGRETVSGVYTYGSPRIMNAALRSVYRERGFDAITYRYRKCWDGIADIPTPPLYEHVGTELYFNSSGRMLVNPTAKAVATDRLLAMRSAIPKQRAVRQPEILWDHGPGGYEKHCYINRDVPLVVSS